MVKKEYATTFEEIKEILLQIKSVDKAIVASTSQQLTVEVSRVKKVVVS